MKRIEAKDPTLHSIPSGNPLDSELAIGCWLVAQRCGYTHHGVYVGDGRVVHYSGLSRGWKRGPIEIVPLAGFSLGRNLWTKSTPTARYVGLQAAERALSRLGEDKYHIMTNNCEHFCAWCLDGKSRSRQVERWLDWPRSQARAIIGQLVEALAVKGGVGGYRRRPTSVLDLSPNCRTA